MLEQVVGVSATTVVAAPACDGVDCALGMVKTMAVRRWTLHAVTDVHVLSTVQEQCARTTVRIHGATRTQQTPRLPASLMLRRRRFPWAVAV
eukprot:5258270-Prymnesium_polylepis.1